MSVDGITVKNMVVMEFPQEQTEEQRLEAFRVFVTSLEKTLERDDYIAVNALLWVKEEK